jgi:hypothetical protein
MLPGAALFRSSMPRFRPLKRDMELRKRAASGSIIFRRSELGKSPLKKIILERNHRAKSTATFLKKFDIKMVFK